MPPFVPVATVSLAEPGVSGIMPRVGGGGTSIGGAEFGRGLGTGAGGGLRRAATGAVPTALLGTGEG